MSHAALHHLDTALDLGMRELAALHEGEVETAAELAEGRERAIAQAWAARAGCDTAIYCEKLRALHTAQERLRTAAAAMHEELRATLSNSRKEGKRLAGYRKAVAHAL